MEKLKIIAVIFATCATSSLVGFGLGYFVSGGISLTAGANAYAPERLTELPGAEYVSYMDFEEETALDDSPAISNAEEHKFIVTSRNGSLVVYSAGAEAEVHDVAVDALPDADRERLEHGIYANTEEELARILEDYGS